LAASLAVVLISAPRLAAQEGKDPGEDLERAIVQSICPNQVRTEKLKNGTAYGCGGCPAFTSFAGEAPSKDKAPDFELRKVLTGAFTHPGSQEVLAEFYGCEPHASNFGGTLILNRSGPKLKRVRWVEGIIGLVRAYPSTSGRELVLSQGGYTGQGESTGWVSTYDFSKQEPTAQTLFTVQDDSGNFCTSDRINIGYISKLDFPDLNGDARPDLRVTVKAGKATVPERFHGHCDEGFKAPDVPTSTIDFVFDGKTFHVTPSTAAALRRVNAQQQ
jgi:hypothetical protein